MPMKSVFILLVLLAGLSLSQAADSQHSPSEGFLNAALAVQTPTGTKKLDLKTIEFVSGIKTDKEWKRIDTGKWIMTTRYKDPVTNVYREYSLTFQKTNGTVRLQHVSYDGRTLSYAELEDFASQIVHNYETHLGVK